MIEEGGGVEFLAAGVGLGAGQDNSFAGTGAGDVTVEPFVAEALADGRAESGAVKLEGIAFKFIEQRVFLGQRGEHAFVEAENEGEFEFGIARAINRADEHLIERRRNDADGQISKAGFEDGQPLAQRQRFGGKSAGEVIEPVGELREDGRVNCRLLIADCRLSGSAPRGERVFDGE